MSISNVICGAKNILTTSMSLMLHNYFFLTVKDQHKVASDTKLSKAVVKQVLEALHSNVIKALQCKDKTPLVGFGILTVVRREARTGRNPQTGESMLIKAYNAVKFRSSITLKKKINEE